QWKDEAEYYLLNVDPLCQFMDKFDQDQLQLVGFYDPNDILGYKLWDPASDYACSDEHKLFITNCTVTNAVPILGIFAFPKKAHVGGWDNRKTVKLVWYGYEK